MKSNSPNIINPPLIIPKISPIFIPFIFIPNSEINPAIVEKAKLISVKMVILIGKLFP